MDAAYLTERITVTKNLIDVYEAALLAFGDNEAGGGVQSYKLDTGQTVQWVTRADLGQLNRTLTGLYNRLSMFQVRLNGSGVVTVRPAF